MDKILNLRRKQFLLDSDASRQHMCKKDVFVSLDEPYQEKVNLVNGYWLTYMEKAVVNYKIPDKS